MDRVERSLREALRELPPPEVDIDGVLSRVHAGAGRRRRSRMAFGAVAVLAVVTGVAWAVQPTDLAHGGTQAAGPSTSLPASGGTTAPTTAPTPAVAVLSVTASSPDTFWVLGSTGCPRTDCATIQRTDTAGRTFTPLAVPSGAMVTRSATTGSISNLRFDHDGVDGWAYGGGLWSTHDAGQSWQPVGFQGFRRADQIVALEVWASSAYALLRHPDGTVDLLRSDVADDNWRAVDTGLRISDAAGGMALSDGIVTFLADAGAGGISLVSGVNGRWAARALPKACSARTPRISATFDSLWLLCAGTSPTAYSSVDAGATWTRAAAPLPAADVIAACDAGHAVVASSTEVTTISPAGRVQTVPVDSHGATRPLYAGFTDTETGYVVFDNGYLLRTDAGGASWSQVDLEPAG
jgi:photosystem II stability/assembly factor-like uncharacterized protein